VMPRDRTTSSPMWLAVVPAGCVCRRDTTICNSNADHRAGPPPNDIHDRFAHRRLCDVVCSPKSLSGLVIECCFVQRPISPFA